MLFLDRVNNQLPAAHNRLIQQHLAPAALRALGTGPKTFSILRDNVYGWFERVDRGVYALSARGRKELAEYQKLVAHYLALVKSRRAAAAVDATAD